MEERRGAPRRQLPIEDAADGAEAVGPDLGQPATSDSGERRRALLVEAEPETQQLCRDALERSGFVVDTVDSGIGAVIAAREALPDLILVDLQLRDVPGREAISWLRSNPALGSTPIIVLTTKNEADTDLAMPRLRKPISQAMLQRVVRDVFKQQSGRPGN